MISREQRKCQEITKKTFVLNKVFITCCFLDMRLMIINKVPTEVLAQEEVFLTLCKERKSCC